MSVALGNYNVASWLY